MVFSQECERTNPDALRRKLRQELLSGFGCDINRKLVQLVKTSGSRSAFATKSVQLCNFMMTWLRVLIIGKHKKANFTEGFSFLSTGFGQSLVQHLLAQSRCSLWAVCQMDTWIKTSGCGKDSVLFVRYQPTSCKAQRQFTPGPPSWPHVSGPSHPFSPH